MTQLAVGSIQFGMGRIEHAFSIIQEEYVDGLAMKEAYFKADYELTKAIDEISDLKAEIKQLKARLKSGRKIKG